MGFEIPGGSNETRERSDPGMEIIRDAPGTSQFVSLSEHQSQTPASFYSGPPVLHYYSPSAKLVILDSELHSSPVFSKLADTTPTDETLTNGDAPHEVVIAGVDVFITSEWA
jgi:chloride channel, nucleotide-sensitive, 1A